MERERFGSRLGFILISAGCAIGLGNVWRFPYITGQYGGAAFVIMYLIFLVILGLPIMTMEFATGRASQKGIAGSLNALEPAGTKWHVYKWFGLLGNVMLMMFYTVVAGWMINYVFKMASGVFKGASSDQITNIFVNMTLNPGELTIWMIIVVVLGMVICSFGLQKGVERFTKIMMVCLLALIVILAIRSVTLPGAGAGVKFYLSPDFSAIFSSWSAFGEAAYAAMGQSFFTLSLGIGAMAIFGSYIGKEHSLFGESIRIGVLDTVVALSAGLIIFPACFAFGVDPGSGAGLVFMTLPNVFEQMWMGQLWGSLFFLFMSFAALSTVVAVFENIIAFCMDQWGWERKKACLICTGAIIVLSMPCILGMNVWSNVALPGIGSIDGMEDFIVSNNLLPLGSLLFVLFCTAKNGWGWKAFMQEANTGDGAKFPQWLFGWMKYGVPALILIIFVMGWLPIIKVWVGLG
ncbi:MAG: sodium-dependent transporter [Coriobacteriales bacterium]|nr:sodium-dependent transporter [Coriobacteriales bacterium]